MEDFLPEIYNESPVTLLTPEALNDQQYTCEPLQSEQHPTPMAKLACTSELQVTYAVPYQKKRVLRIRPLKPPSEEKLLRFSPLIRQWLTRCYVTLNSNTNKPVQK